MTQDEGEREGEPTKRARAVKCSQVKRGKIENLVMSKEADKILE